jgi:peptidoglycan hydrolase-like protein with peptidoglycan-binding domain
MKWNTTAGFLGATIGKSYDMDGAFGRTCWDYADYFWLNQVGRALDTGGTGQARGCWTVAAARKRNAGTDFDLITNKNDLSEGDWIITNGGKYGHVGIVVGVVKKGVTVRLQGQNQGTFRTKVTVINFGLNDFLGAFRFKKWEDTEDFLPVKGYWTRGDCDMRVGELAKFMFNTFPAYTPYAALGNYYGKNLAKAIKEFQRRTGLQTDGNTGPLTYDKLKQFGFKG